MLTVAAEPTFRQDVTARVPGDGGYRDEKFSATFRVLAPEEIDQFDLSTTDGSSAFLRRVVVGLDGVADAQGAPIEWSAEVLAAVLRLPWARQALARTYFGAVSGAKSGN